MSRVNNVFHTKLGEKKNPMTFLLLLLLLSRFSRVRLCHPRDGSPPDLSFLTSRMEPISRKMGDWPKSPVGVKELSKGLPWWSSGYELAYQCRGHGFSSWSGKIPHALSQLNLCAASTDPTHLNYRSLRVLQPVHTTACTLQQEKPPQQEAPASQLESSPRAIAAARESLCAAMQTQCGKNK